MKLREYLGYASGDVANNLTFSMASSFLLIYYTDVAAIGAEAAGALFLLVRVWGGVTDLFAGRRVDETSTQWGKFRPYLLFASGPLLLLLVALFSIPRGLSDGATLAWAYISYALFSLAYSFVNIPYGSLVRDTAGMLRHNRPLVILCASALLFLTGMFAVQTVAVYYARDVLGDADLYIVMTIVQTVGMLAAAAIVPRAVERFGKKRTYVASGVVAAAAGIGLGVAPGSTPAVGLTLFGIYGLGLGVINTVIFALQADTVDYGKWYSGVRAEGSNYAVLSFMRKAGQGVGGAAAAYTIGVGGYISGAAAQTDSAVTSIRVAAGILPAAVILGATAIMLAYPLTEKVFRRVVAELAQRRAASEMSAAAGAPT